MIFYRTLSQDLREASGRKRVNLERRYEGILYPTLYDALLLGGLWWDGRPTVMVEAEENARLLTVVPEEEVRKAVGALCAPFGVLRHDMAREVEAWRVALHRPVGFRDRGEVDRALRNLWSDRTVEEMSFSELCRRRLTHPGLTEPTEARAAWERKASSELRMARWAWGHERRLQAIGGQHAWDGLTWTYAARMGWISRDLGNPYLDLRAAYGNGLGACFPVSDRVVGYCMYDPKDWDTEGVDTLGTEIVSSRSVTKTGTEGKEDETRGGDTAIGDEDMAQDIEFSIEDAQAAAKATFFDKGTSLPVGKHRVALKKVKYFKAKVGSERWFVIEGQLHWTDSEMKVGQLVKVGPYGSDNYDIMWQYIKAFASAMIECIPAFVLTKDAIDSGVPGKVGQEIVVTVPLLENAYVMQHVMKEILGTDWDDAGVWIEVFGTEGKSKKEKAVIYYSFGEWGQVGL